MMMMMMMMMMMIAVNIAFPLFSFLSITQTFSLRHEYYV